MPLTFLCIYLLDKVDLIHLDESFIIFDLQYAYLPLYIYTYYSHNLLWIMITFLQ